jgi:hypothetical protein
LLLSSGFIVTMPKDLDRSSVPVFDDVVVCCKPGVDEGAKVFTNRLTSIPFGDAEATCRILREAVKTLTEGVVIAFSRVDIDQLLCQYRPFGNCPQLPQR